MASTDLLMAVAVTAELCGRTFSEGAARMFVSDLSAYPEAQVIRALARCRKEVKGLLTTSDVVSRLDDGRPGSEEAWALVPKSESESIVWTSEMAEAFNVAAPLLNAGDAVGARMAFKEVYQREVIRSKDAGLPVKWMVSEGTDAEQRKRVLIEATASGRITPEIAYSHCPALPPPKSLLLGLPPQNPTRATKAREQLAALANKMRMTLGGDAKRWAKELRTRDQGGAPLTESQRESWRAALRHNEGMPVKVGDYIPIDHATLPPGMRADIAREKALKDAT